jgi:uncharacterized protein (TIGR02231 family)
MTAQDSREIVSSEVKEITIFLNKARVERQGNIRLKKGRNQIVFPYLSPHADAASLQVSGKGNFKIISARYELNYLVTLPVHPELKMLEDSLEKLQWGLEVMLNRKSVLSEEQSLLLANKSIGGANTGINSRELELVADLFKRRLSRIKEELLTLSQSEKTQRENIQKVHNQIHTFRQKSNQPSGAVLVEVEAMESGPARFDFSYLVSQVSWTPFYEVRVNENEKQLSLIFNAAVMQQTGEEWKKATVKLTTYNPAIGNYKPELTPWYLNFQDFITLGKKSARYHYPLKIEQETQKVMPEQEMPYATWQELIPTEQTGLYTTYEIAVPYDISSDGKEVMLMVQEYKMPVQQIHFAVPKLEKDVFVMGHITNWQQQDLLAGKAAIYYQGSYTGETFLNPHEASDTLYLPLGRDRHVVIKRELLKDYSAGQFIGNNRVRTFTYEFVIKNQKSYPVTLWMEDQIPVSQVKEIEVKALELSGGDLDKETGKVTWKIDLKANEQVKKRFSFSVKHPRGKYIPGL